MEWLYGASESSNMEVDIGYLPQVCGLSQCSTRVQLLLRGLCCQGPELWNLCDPHSLELSLGHVSTTIEFPLICVSPPIEDIGPHWQLFQYFPFSLSVG